MKTACAPKPTASSVATQNACNVCMPLGACLAYRGVAGAIPFLHGPQGCATYIRRYLIAHFREPMDIACSSFNEESAIFGGGRDLHRGLENVQKQYDPAMIGIATTCLAETIGDDLPMLIRQFKESREAGGAALTQVATPSYRGTNADGFHAAVRSVLETLVDPETKRTNKRVSINLFPNILSPADLRHLQEIVEDFGLHGTMLPDYSETLDRPVLSDYERIPQGGTSLEAIRAMAQAEASLFFGRTVREEFNGATYLKEAHAVPAHQLGIPIGIRETDIFFESLEQLSGQSRPEKHEKERGRLVDAYVDGHKYLFGKRIAIVAEADLCVALASFVAEIGAVPVLCATGGRSGAFEMALEAVGANAEKALEGADFAAIEGGLEEAELDLIFGCSRCAPVARRKGVPLIRIGMPIHDRIGAQRVLHVGYRGAQALFDATVNALIQCKQDRNDAGYMTM